MPEAELQDYPFLAAVAGMIDDAGLTVTYVAATDTGAEHILVNAGTADDPLIPVRVVMLDNLLDHETNDEAGIDEADQPLILHATALLPFAIGTDRITDVMHAVFMLNRCHPLCAFGVSPQGACYAQATVALARPDDLDNGVTEITIATLCTVIELHTPALKSLASGAKTLAHFTSELEAIGLSALPVYPAVA
jgi:hypothetical protein